MIGNKDINPLNVFGLRKMEHCPPHFQQVTFKSKVNNATIENWIYDNLSGRFYFGYVYQAGESTVESYTLIGFEEQAEASYFMLCLDSIQATEYRSL